MDVERRPLTIRLAVWWLLLCGALAGIAGAVWLVSAAVIGALVEIVARDARPLGPGELAVRAAVVVVTVAATWAGARLAWQRRPVGLALGPASGVVYTAAFAGFFQPDVTWILLVALVVPVLVVADPPARRWLRLDRRRSPR